MFFKPTSFVEEGVLYTDFSSAKGEGVDMYLNRTTSNNMPVPKLEHGSR